jgi:hypothetical protein
LEKASESENRYLDAVADLTTKNWEDIPTCQVFQIQQHCLYLALPFNMAKEKMNGWTWKTCCKQVINMLSSCGMKATSCALTIMEWYRQSLPSWNGIERVNIPKKDLPSFLLINPEICSTIKQYEREHLPEFLIEFFFDYVHHTTLPQLVSDTVGRSKDEMGEEQYKLELTKF